MIVLKLGGSLLTLSDLATRIETVVAQRPAERIALVVGGGAAADVVREWDRVHQLGEEVGHRLALHAMTLTAECVTRLLTASRIVGDSVSLNDAWSVGLLPVLHANTWLARAERAGRPTVPHSWEATSDSIAAWLVGELCAKELILLKSVPRPDGGIQVAVEAGHVDRYFPEAARGIPQVSWANLRTPDCRVEVWVSSIDNE